MNLQISIRQETSIMILSLLNQGIKSPESLKRLFIFSIRGFCKGWDSRAFENFKTELLIQEELRNEVGSISSHYKTSICY